METLSPFVQYAVWASLLLQVAQAYLKLNKLWSRRHEKAVAESLSIYALILGFASNAPWIVDFAIKREWKGAFRTVVKVFQIIVNMAIGIGIWVPDPEGRSVMQKFLAALRTENAEVGDLVKALTKPAGAPILLRILHEVAMVDQHLDDREREFIDRFAVTWGLQYDHEAMTKAHGGGDPVRLRALVADYLAISPPTKQVTQIRNVLDALAKIDDEVAQSEALVLGEVMAMLTEYISEDGESNKVDVLIVPQNQVQNEAIRQVLTDVELREVRGGSAFLVGSYYSGAYAEMVAAKYRALNFFSIVDTHVSAEAEMPTTGKNT